MSADDSYTLEFCLMEKAPSLFIREAGDQMVTRALVPPLEQFVYPP